jgi:ethanolamine utilization protein EutQ
MTKAAPKHVSLAAVDFAPRFAYGDQAQVAEVCGTGDGTPLGTGFVRMKNASIPWTVRYDEVVLVLEGQLTIKMASGDITAGPMECIWLPADTDLVYQATEALVFYAIHPADWAKT